MSDMEVRDESGDRKYFTIIPNYILNHSTANDQALYLQMKRYAGERGTCFASEKTLMDRLKIGRQAFKKSLNYLLDHNWIKFVGVKEVNTKGGMQPIKVYTVTDLWELNNEYYSKNKGVAEMTPPVETKGVSETTEGGVWNGGGGVSETAIEEEPLLRRSNEEEYTPTPRARAIWFFGEVKDLNEGIPSDVMKGFIAQIADGNKSDPQIVVRELKKFASYWTELNPTGKKQRWQLEKTFEVNRRLATWFSRVGIQGGSLPVPSRGKGILE